MHLIRRLLSGNLTLYVFIEVVLYERNFLYNQKLVKKAVCYYIKYYDA